jgi:protocatechuate 3,4-dioxygenase beta subunit
MRHVIMLVCLLALGRQASAQDAPAAKETGKASLEGTVNKEPGGEPLKKAIVEVIAENQEEGGNYTATSDQDGHFKIRGIQPGRYRMFVERPGYLEVDEKRRRSQGVVLAFGAGQELKDQKVHMLAAAVVTGRVLDEDGDPMPGVEVRVLRRRFGAGHAKFEGPGTETNDLGEFRIGGLLAGKYYLSASPPPNLTGFMFPPKRVDETGAPSPDTAYVTTYYPNTIDRSQVAAIELHPGDETPVDFSLARTHTARIRGSVAGLAPGTKAVVVLRARDSNTLFIGGDVDKEGKFDIPHVAPGAYAVVVATETADTPLSVRRNIEVSDSNIDGLTLSPFTGAMIRGKVRFSSKPRMDLSRLSVVLHRIDGAEDFADSILFGDDGGPALSAFGQVKDDGSFELKDVLPGLYEIEISSNFKAMADALVESVTAGTKDVADTGLNINGGTLAMDVSVSLGAGEVNGTAVNDKTEPIANAVVVAVPEEKFRTRQSHYRRGATDQDGRFLLNGLWPGKYTLYAWEVLDGEDYLDADFLKQFESQGTPIKVEKASRQTVALKVIPAGADQP